MENRQDREPEKNNIATQVELIAALIRAVYHYAKRHSPRGSSPRSFTKRR